MTKRVNNLEKLGEIIERREPAEVLYELGEGRERTELLVTYIDGDSRITNRIASPPLTQLRRDNDEVSMDFTDSDKAADRYFYRGLRPRGTVFEMPSRPSDELGYELGDLAINLKGGRTLGISQYLRAA